MKHKARSLKGSSSSGSGRLRFAILAATVAAFLVVPVAQAAASTIKVTLAGTGSGKVLSFKQAEPSAVNPRINCPGTCEATIGEEGYSQLVAIPAAGSKFTGWTITEGFAGIWCEGGAEEEEAVAELQKKATEEEPEVYGEYAGVGGRCLVVEEGGIKITANFTAIPSGPALTLKKAGTGTGTVVSSPAGINCGTACPEETASFTEGSEVVLTASPASTAAFVSWKGCTSTEGRKCKVTMSAAKTVTATFTKTYNVAVSKSGTGIGQVLSAPAGINCGTNCSSNTAAFLEGKAVTLKAKPFKTAEFSGWTISPDSCTLSEGGTWCTFTPSANETVGAQFTEIAQKTLTVKKAGNGVGTVKSSPVGINCGTTCSQQAASYYLNTPVTLTATVLSGKGSTFTGWSGAGCSGTGTCSVTMSAAKEVTATFE